MAKPIPDGMHSVTPQLTVEGAADAIEFYKEAFDAVEIDRAPDPSGKKVWHASLRIGNSVVFVNDAFPEMGGAPSRCCLWIYGADVDAAFKRAIDAGAHVKMPLSDMFWGDRMGSVVDRWGNQWTLAQHMKDLSPAEIERASEEAAKQWRTKK